MPSVLRALDLITSWLKTNLKTALRGLTSMKKTTTFDDSRLPINNLTAERAEEIEKLVIPAMKRAFKNIQTIAAFLESHRASKNVSKSELARETGISRQQLWEYLSGRAEPGFSNFCKLVQVLEIPASAVQALVYSVK